MREWGPAAVAACRLARPLEGGGQGAYLESRAAAAPIGIRGITRPSP